MNILIEIPDEKLLDFNEILCSLGYVISQKNVSNASLYISELNEAVNEINMINEGKIKSRSALEFINEL